MGAAVPVTRPRGASQAPLHPTAPNPLTYTSVCTTLQWVGGLAGVQSTANSSSCTRRASAPLRRARPPHIPRTEVRPASHCAEAQTVNMRRRVRPQRAASAAEAAEVSTLGEQQRRLASDARHNLCVGE